MARFTRYRKDSEESFALGAFAVIELLRSRPELVTQIWIRPDFRGDRRELDHLCRQCGIVPLEGERPFSILSPKDNIYVLAQFRKAEARLDPRRDHIVLVEPSDMGNLGTILRTATGFGIRNAAMIGDGVDFWNPKVVRASMGAAFHVNVHRFPTIEDYRKAAGERRYYCFMLDGQETLEQADFSSACARSFVFGNEASGLPESYRTLGRSIRIEHSAQIDSLNLSIAVGIALYQATAFDIADKLGYDKQYQ